MLSRPIDSTEGPTQNVTMITQTTEASAGPIIEIQLTGKLEKADYEAFVPEIEGMIEKYGKIRMLVIFEDFHGWSAGALWKDIKFDAKHFNDLERVALVGDDKWEKGMAIFCEPFTTAEVQFFPSERIKEARVWIEAA